MSSALQVRLRDLVRLLEDLHSRHGELLELVEAKVRALRNADRQALGALVDREGALIARLQEREGLRRQLMDQVGRELGMSPVQARKLTASELALRLDEPSAARLLSAAASLRGTALRLAQANRVAGAISREMVSHLERVFESIRRSSSTPIGYAPDGNLVRGLEHRLVDAVG